MYIFKKEEIETSLQNHLIWLKAFKLVGSNNNPLVPGSSPVAPTRTANPHQKWWEFYLLRVT